MKAARKRRESWPGDKPTSKLRRFEVTVTRTVVLALDESVLAQGMSVGDPIFGFKKEDLEGTAREFAEAEVLKHLVFNLVCNGLGLSQIDGYANCPDKSAVVGGSHQDWDIDIEGEFEEKR